MRISPRPGLAFGAKRPRLLNKEFCRSCRNGCSGVSSLSAFSGEEKFSAPEEKSISAGLRGVVQADWPNRGVCDEDCEVKGAGDGEACC